MNRLFWRRIALACPLITADRASRLLTALLALLLAGAPVAAQTINQNIGGGIGFTFDGGISGKGGGSGPPPTQCASTGIFNLGNVCNDIYFIGALK